MRWRENDIGKLPDPTSRCIFTWPCESDFRARQAVLWCARQCYPYIRPFGDTIGLSFAPLFEWIAPGPAERERLPRRSFCPDLTSRCIFTWRRESGFQARQAVL